MGRHSITPVRHRRDFDRRSSLAQARAFQHQPGAHSVLETLGKPPGVGELRNRASV